LPALHGRGGVAQPAELQRPRYRLLLRHRSQDRSRFPVLAGLERHQRRQLQADRAVCRPVLLYVAILTVSSGRGTAIPEFQTLFSARVVAEGIEPTTPRLI